MRLSGSACCAGAREATCACALGAALGHTSHQPLAQVIVPCCMGKAATQTICEALQACEERLMTLALSSKAGMCCLHEQQSHASLQQANEKCGSHSTSCAVPKTNTCSMGYSSKRLDSWLLCSRPGT